MKYIVFFFLSIFVVVPIKAQKVFPCIVDSKDKQPVVSATLILLDSLNNIVANGISDVQGRCIVKSKKIDSCKTMRISSVGYSSRTINIADVKDTIFLNATSTKLKEVEVKAILPSFIKVSPGMFTYFVEKDSAAQRKNTLDIMSRVPLLLVSPNSGISAECGKNIVYELNGMRSALFSGDIIKLFQTIKANSLKRIEVNTQPGLQFGQNTIVVNIITKGHLEGLVGTLTSKLTDQNWNNSFYGLTKNKNLTISFDYQNIWDFEHSKTTEVTETRNNSELYYNSSKTLLSNGYKSNAHSFELSASYEASNTTLFNSYGRIILSSFSNPHENSQEIGTMYKKNGIMNYSYSRNNHRLFKNTEYDFTFSMEHSFIRNYILNGKLYIGYNFYNRPYQQTSTTIYEKIDSVNMSIETLNEFYNYIEQENSKSPIHTFESNIWYKMGQKFRLTVGGKFVVRPQTTERYLHKFFFLPCASVQEAKIKAFNNHNQQVAAIYGSYGYFTDKVKLDLGIRYEYQKDKLLHSKMVQNFRKSFNDILPSLNVAYYLKNNTSMEFSYNMNVSRPNITVLDPYVDENTPMQITYGNQNLKPENSHVLQCTLNYKICKYRFMTSLNYTHTNRIMLNYQFIENNILHNTTGNIGQKDYTSLYNSISGRASKNIFLRFIHSLSYIDYRASVINRYRNGWSYYVKGFLEYELPNNYYINLEGNYHTRNILLQGVGYESYNYNITVTKYCLNNNLRLSISADNFFNIHNANKVYKTADSYNSCTFVKRYQAMFLLKVSLSLGSLKANVKKTDKKIERNNDVKYDYDE